MALPLWCVSVERVSVQKRRLAAEEDYWCAGSSQKSALFPGMPLDLVSFACGTGFPVVSCLSPVDLKLAYCCFILLQFL